MTTNTKVTLDTKIAELKKLMAAEKLDTKAIVAMSREVDGIQREAERADADKAQVAITSLNAHINSELIKAIKPIMAEGGIEKLHGKACVLRFNVTMSEAAAPVYATVISGAATAKAARTGGGGGGNGGVKGNVLGTGMDGDTLVAKYGTAEEQASYAASKDKNVRYGLVKKCAKAHTAAK